MPIKIWGHDFSVVTLYCLFLKNVVFALVFRLFQKKKQRANATAEKRLSRVDVSPFS